MIENTSSLRRAITPPAFDESRLHRERLVSSLLSALDHKLVVVVAAPGYGKSVLMADFAAHTDLPVCWLDMSEEDQDPMRLALVLKASLQRRFRRLRNKLDLKPLSGSLPEALARALIAAIDEHIPERFVIVLDDVHLINASRDALKLIDTLILESPDRLTFIAAGRALPDISISKLIVNAQMFGIGTETLALTAEEVVALVAKTLQLGLESAQVDLLLDQTDGWIPGVLLSARSIANKEDDVLFGKPLLHEFLIATAFQDEPSDLREFMLTAAVLPEMTSTSCDLVLKRDDSQKMVEVLSRKGLFITMTEGPQKTYVFHDLYRNFLTDTLKETAPELYRRLNVRTAKYYVSSGEIERAISLFALGGNTKQAASLAEKHAREMFEVGRIKTLTQWAQILKESSDKTPNTLLYLATAYADIGELEAAKTELDRAIVALELVSVSKRRKMLARAETVRGWIAYRQGEYSQVLAAVEQVERHLPQRGAYLRRAICFRLRALATYASGGDLSAAEDFSRKSIMLLEKTDDEYALANNLLDLSRIRMELGDLREASAMGMRAYKILDRLGSPYPLANCLNNVAVFLHLKGDFEEAQYYFREGLQKAYQAANRFIQVNLHYGQADLFCDLGLADPAGDLYGHGLSIATQLDERRLIFYGFVGLATLHRRWGSSGSALEWLDRAEGLADDERKSALTSLHRGALNLKIDPEKAEAVLWSLHEYGRRFLNASAQLFLDYLLSKALEEQGKPSAAADQSAAPS